jgi:hypothetical protein
VNVTVQLHEAGWQTQLGSHGIPVTTSAWSKGDLQDEVPYTKPADEVKHATHQVSVGQ